MEGVYTWEFWYEDVASGKVLGKDLQGYEFTNTPPSPDDTTQPFILIISPVDGKTVFHSNLLRMYGTAFDPSGIETLTVNGQDVISVQAFGVVPFYAFVDLNEGLNEITILAKDASENHNEQIEEITVNYYPFNVKITAPNDLDRFRPDDSISFRGEVSDGTPPFTYKWTINDDEYYSGPLDDRYIELTKVLSSGKYELKLEVIDHEGYSIETEEIEIDVSPLEVDTGFRPNPDGYQFDNFEVESLSWDIFRNTYGADAVEINGKRIPTAEEFYNNKYETSADGGSCFGMSASSLVIYQNDFQSWDIAGQRFPPVGPVINPGRDRSLDSADLCEYGIPLLDFNDNGVCDPEPRTWGIFPPFISTPTEWVGYYHGRWYGAAVQEEAERYHGPNTAYNLIKQRIAGGNWILDPIVLSVYWWDENYTDQNMNGLYDVGEPYEDTNGDHKLTATGHTVVPYKIEENPEHEMATVYVYDSNYPGENCYIYFNLISNIAFTEEHGVFISDWVYANDLSTIQLEPQINKLDTVSTSGHLLYTDTPGNQLGYFNGEFKSEIPGVYRVMIPGQINQTNPTEIYFISDLNLKRELYGLDDGIATVSISRPNSLVIADVRVSPSSVDELRVPPNGSSVEFISGEGTSSLSLMLDRENTDMARLARINISGIESGNRLKLLFSGDSNVSMKNEGSQKECNIYLEQIGFNNSSYGYLKDIIIEENSSIRITPLDWNDITNNLIMVEHDIGNDGTIEYTETLSSLDIKPPSTITNLHPTTGTTWLNFTWLNPLDPDFNHTEIYLNSTFLTNIPAPQNYYNATGLLPDTSYELSTRTVDINGNINLTWVNDTASTLPASGTTLNLYTGWNLISLPLMPEDTSITSLLSSINGNYSIVWAYNASDTADHWKKYDPSAPFGNDLTTMEAGKGYWIMMTSNDTLFVTGDVPVSTDIILKAGWNLIGYNSLVGQPIENALASVSGNYSIIWAYNASDSADHWKKYDSGAPFGNDLANLESGSGYWIMMTSDDILEI